MEKPERSKTEKLGLVIICLGLALMGEWITLGIPEIQRSEWKMFLVLFGVPLLAAWAAATFSRYDRNDQDKQ